MLLYSSSRILAFECRTALIAMHSVYPWILCATGSPFVILLVGIKHMPWLILKKKKKKSTFYENFLKIASTAYFFSSRNCND